MLGAFATPAHFSEFYEGIRKIRKMKAISIFEWNPSLWYIWELYVCKWPSIDTDVAVEAMFYLDQDRAVIFIEPN